MSDLTRRDVHAMLRFGIRGPTSRKTYMDRSSRLDVCDCCGVKSSETSLSMSLIFDWCLCPACTPPSRYYNLPHIAGSRLNV
jgi:hypothetical protein